MAKEVMAEKGVEFEYKFGTMIEIPRAASLADEIAKSAEFFSFGTNDLTQTTFGYQPRRRRAQVPAQVRRATASCPKNPFQVLTGRRGPADARWAWRRGRKTRPDLEVGICGEHGGDPESIEFCHSCRHELRLLLAVPRAGRAPCRRQVALGIPQQKEKE
jgi:pyruvate,orthophosphate dikinase